MNLVPRRFDQCDVAWADVFASSCQCFDFYGRVGRDAGEIHNGTFTDNLFQHQFISGVAVGQDVSRGIDMRERVDRGFDPRHLVLVAAGEVAGVVKCGLPAKMLGNWHGKVNDLGH